MKFAINWNYTKTRKQHKQPPGWFSLLKPASLYSLHWAKARIPGKGLLPSADVRLTVTPLNMSNCQTGFEDSDPEEPMEQHVQLKEGWSAGLWWIQTQCFLCGCRHLKIQTARLLSESSCQTKQISPLWCQTHRRGSLEHRAYMDVCPAFRSWKTSSES